LINQQWNVKKKMQISFTEVFFTSTEELVEKHIHKAHEEATVWGDVHLGPTKSLPITA
jgi:hypothetical protein